MILLEPRPRQKEAFEFALANPYSILAMGPRTGKSVVTLMLHDRLKSNTLIVAPAYLVPNWHNEIRKWLGSDPLVTSFSKGSDIYEVWDSDIVLISYDLAMKAPHLFEWCDNLFMDEAHKLASMATKRTQYFHKQIFENSIGRVHPLSGTPVKNRVKEFYSPLSMVYYNPKIKDANFLERFPDEISFADHFSFRDEYTAEIHTAKGLRFVKILKWKGVRNVPELKRYLKGRYLRIKTSEMMDFSVGFEDFLVSTSPNKKLLSAFERHFTVDGNERVMPTEKAEAALQKVPFTTQYVEDLLESVECVPIYTDHREPARALAAKFGVEAITGDMTPKRRAEAARRFQAGETRVLVATIKSLSEGVSLSRANDLVLNDFPWVPGDIEQTILRLINIDKKAPVTVHRIFGSPQDQYIYETLEEKAADIAKAVEK